MLYDKFPQLVPLVCVIVSLLVFCCFAFIISGIESTGHWIDADNIKHDYF